MKITSNFEIRNNTLLNVGDSYVVISFDQYELDAARTFKTNSTGTHDDLASKISIKVFSGPSEQEPKSFRKGSGKITLGRSLDCHFTIHDSMLSRIQCTFEYSNEDRRWFLHDGSIKGNEYKPSTNGTWVYLNEEAKIYDGFMFKANHTIFKITTK